MIRKFEFPTITERYEHNLHLQNDISYPLSWKFRVLQYFTCGENNYIIECWDVIDNLVFIQPINKHNTLKGKLTIGVV